MAIREKVVERAVEKVREVILESVYHSKRRDMLILTTSKDDLKEKIAGALKSAFEDVQKDITRGQ